MTTISVLLASPLASNLMRVFLSEQPRANSVLGPTDVQNRLNWTLAVQGTPPPRVFSPVVEQVENPLAQPTAIVGQPGAWSVDLRVDRRLIYTAAYLVQALNFVAANGDLLDPTNNHWTAPGDIAIPVRQPAQPNRTTQNVDFDYDFFKGAYVLDGKNDVATHTGNDALKKRIIRRLISTPGGFYHLPEYGVGIKDKALFNASEIGKLRFRVLDQVTQEDDVQRADVAVSFTAGVLYVAVAVQPRAQQVPFQMTLEVAPSGQVLLSS